GSHHFRAGQADATATLDAVGSRRLLALFAAGLGLGATGCVEIGACTTCAQADGGVALDGGAEPDASFDPLDADPPLPLGEFGPASALVTVNTDLYLEENPTVTADGLELYFDSD